MPSSFTWLPLAKANPPPNNKTTPQGTIFSAACQGRSGGKGLPFSERSVKLSQIYISHLQLSTFFSNPHYHNIDCYFANRT